MLAALSDPTIIGAWIAGGLALVGVTITVTAQQMNRHADKRDQTEMTKNTNAIAETRLALDSWGKLVEVSAEQMKMLTARVDVESQRADRCEERFDALSREVDELREGRAGMLRTVQTLEDKVASQATEIVRLKKVEIEVVGLKAEVARLKEAS